MSPISPLNEIWQNYQLATDCFKITRRTLVKGDVGLLSNTGFAAASLEDADRIIVKGRNEWDDFVILSLWAVFERLIIDFVREKAKILLDQHPRQFTEKLHGLVDGQIEFWKIGDKLDLFKGVVDVELIGQAKQIKYYRDWIVHKSKIPAANVTPIQAYNVLHRIVTTISAL
ncbi:MAG: hypothetical protein P4L55_06870 [Syntrophobacteraceae bacterium]|nr:hypothetical protein [Syntrophobacteraceae bacterium]